MSPTIVGTIPQWGMFATTATILGIIVRWQLGLRKLSVDAQQVEVNAHTAANINEADIRDHYAKEVERLTEKLENKDQHFAALENHWRNMLDASDRRHEECEKARAELRVELSEMHSKIGKAESDLRGLYSQIAELSSDKLVILDGRKPSKVAPEAAKSAHRVKKITGEGK